LGKLYEFNEKLPPGNWYNLILTTDTPLFWYSNIKRQDNIKSEVVCLVIIYMSSLHILNTENRHETCNELCFIMENATGCQVSK